MVALRSTGVFSRASAAVPACGRVRVRAGDISGRAVYLGEDGGDGFSTVHVCVSRSD